METALTPLEFAHRARKLYGKREAVVDGDLRLSYSEFFDRCDRWSAALYALGVRQGDRVGVIAPNIHQHLEQYYAVPQLGAVLVPLNYRLTADDFLYLASHSGCKVLCVYADYLDAIDSVRDRMQSVEHFVALEGGDGRKGWLQYEQLISAAQPDFPHPQIAETDLITINYTSGTTSRPKGVMITHRNAWINTIATLVHWHMTPADRYLWTLPMFHANGWTFTWTVTAAGATHVCLRKVVPTAVYEACNRERITHLCAAPTILIGVANAPDDLRRQARHGVKVLTAGAPPAAATIERVEGDLGWEITHIYGLTETSPFISICEPLPEHDELAASDRANVKACQGVELIGTGELRVVDPDGHDVPADGKTLGEIVARGNVIMKGYYKDPEATAAAMQDGWFHSGDAAVVHPDGYAEIRDRIKDVIVSGGENISSIEVEGALLRHPAILEVAVVGLKSEQWGESPHAFVVLAPGKTATADELRTFAREHLAHFKVPADFHFIDALPKTATGKVQKFELRGRQAAMVTQ